jgi:hypothetical protein
MATIRDVIFDSRHPASIARILAEYQGWITLADPEGNEFCIQRAIR